jgi:hypothetical protein
MTGQALLHSSLTLITSHAYSSLYEDLKLRRGEGRWRETSRR